MVPISKVTSKSSGGRHRGVCHSEQLAGKVAVDAVAPGVAKGLHLLWLPREVLCKRSLKIRSTTKGQNRTLQILSQYSIQEI
jgi:hypothetical protein